MKIPFFSRKPLVSVILPSFNHAAFVREAVQSVLDQTWQSLELIVVDDGSTDGTPEVVAAIQDPRLKLVRIADNRAVHPRNLAISQARGKYVAFQNSDDVWDIHKLAAQIKVMEHEDNRGCSACFTGVDLIDATSLPAHGTWADQIFSTKNRPAASWLRYFFDKGNCLAIPSALVRRVDLVKTGGLRASLVQLGDFDLWIQLAALGEFVILPEKLTSMRIMEGVNLSGPSPRAARRAHIELVSLLERYVEPSIVDQLPSIFPELPMSSSAAVNKIALALYSWTLGGVYALLADRIVAKVMESAYERAEAVSVHGTSFIQTFLERRCEYAFVWHPSA